MKPRKSTATSDQKSDSVVRTNVRLLGYQDWIGSIVKFRTPDEIDQVIAALDHLKRAADGKTHFHLQDLLCGQRPSRAEITFFAPGGKLDRQDRELTRGADKILSEHRSME